MYDLYGEPPLLLRILISIFLLLITVSIIYLVVTSNNNISYYKYVDLDNNEGIAKHCQFSDNSARTHSGGQGMPICELDDGTIIAVKQYKFIKEIKGDE